MIIKNISRVEKANKITLRADVAFSHGKNESVYLTTDKKHADSIANDASPFLAAFLLPAMKDRENIVIHGSVSAELLKNTNAIMQLIESWQIGLSPISISADTSAKDTGNPKGVATFFSAGVDSFYTYLKHAKADENKITHLILVHGFDIPLANTSFFAEVRETVEKIATEEKVDAIFIETNLGEVIEKHLVWDFGHGGALAAVALFLRNGLKTVFIPGAVRQDELFPYGVHPELDSLWSTEHMTLIHDGTEYNRLGKIMSLVGSSPLALKYLRVCTQNLKGKYNCSRCYKCLTTMIMLVCANALEKSETFDKKIDLQAVKNMYYDYDLAYNKQGEGSLAVLREEHRAVALQQAIKISLERSKHPHFTKKVMKSLATFDQKYNNRRFYRLVFQMNNKQERNMIFKFLFQGGLLK